MKENILDPVVTALRNGLGDRLVAVVLFGSRARGEADRDSDWDLLVIARDLPPKIFQRHLYIKRLLPEDWRGRVAILAKTPKEFEAGVPALFLDVALDGMILYDPHHYMSHRLGYLRTLIRERGLQRVQVGRELLWRWERPPGPEWSIDWQRAR